MIMIMMMMIIIIIRVTVKRREGKNTVIYICALFIIHIFYYWKSAVLWKMAPCFRRACCHHRHYIIPVS
jgi:hypothetical protein